ncbi:hypothetical protein [Streptomyces sp. NBC_00059]|uniref:hypothetical protein n=1 Tax=Streptomyces sp. NBC_00059 TaxID=2975635 RepID=UPI00225A4444|nr:hypothetical protein [Streptomyces sp. NBC_00059]MCX5416490.1 hypothetical protein [Streptomyces sp. NBC_00059]
MDEETHHPANPGPGPRPDPGPGSRPGPDPDLGPDCVTCARCGTGAEGADPPPTWLCSVENGRREYICDNCAPEHIRAIESRLDSSWW